MNSTSFFEDIYEENIYPQDNIYQKNHVPSKEEYILNKLKNKISLLEKSYDTYIKIINDYSKEIMKLREILFTNRKLNVKNLDKSNNLIKEQNFIINENKDIEQDIMKIKEAIEIIELIGINNYEEIQKKLHQINLLQQNQKNRNNHLDNSLHKNYSEEIKLIKKYPKKKYPKKKYPKKNIIETNIIKENKIEDIYQSSYNLRNKKRRRHVIEE